MKPGGFVQQWKPPCDQCLYKLGLVQTLTNPCPPCRENGYAMLERFQRELSGGDTRSG